MKSSTKTAAAPAADGDIAEARRKALRFLHEGKRAEAEKILHAADPESPEILSLLGQAAQAYEDYAAAVGYYNKAIAGADLPEAHKGLIGSLIGAQQIPQALHALDRATKLLGWDYDMVVYAGVIYLFGNNREKSLEFLLKALKREPERLEAKGYFNHYFQVTGDTPSHNEELKSALIACMREEKNDQYYLIRPWFMQMANDPAAAGFRALLEAQDYEGFAALFAKTDYRRFLTEPYFTLGLEKLTIHKPVFETLIANIRRYYLMSIAEGDSLSTGDFALLCALAKRCYIYEYLPSVTAEEQETLDELRAEVQKANAARPEEIGIIAAYEPLSGLSMKSPLQERAHLMRHEVGALIRQQIMEPAQEREIRKTIESLSPIEDATSKAVQNMYEENPYPRWLHTTNYVSLNPRFPRGHGKKILIAGCGTGMQVTHVAAAWPAADILAVDLSATSIAYAIRKVGEYGYDNVTYKQGDILKLGEILEAESYDYIESTGVLHHLKNPMAGWSVLTKLLKPGGRMNIGLYSKHARVNVEAARQKVKEKGFPATPEGIRAFRAYIKSLPKDDPLYQVTTWQDFYSLSNCRDLLFHVQETSYHLRDIKKCLDELGLEFDGFKRWPHPYIKTYRERFPEDKRMVNLDNWDVLEDENPDMFLNHNIYLFYCKKPERKS